MGSGNFIGFSKRDEESNMERKIRIVEQAESGNGSWCLCDSCHDYRKVTSIFAPTWILGFSLGEAFGLDWALTVPFGKDDLGNSFPQIHIYICMTMGRWTKVGIVFNIKQMTYCRTKDALCMQ